MKKNIKSKNTKQTAYIFIFLFLLILFFYLISILSNKPTSYQPKLTTTYNPQQPREYRSKNLKFAITVPSDFQIEERFTIVNLVNAEGEISIDRIGTNFDDLEGYLQNLVAKNKVLIINKNSYQIGSLNAISSIIRHPISKRPDEKVYFIYEDNWVYSLSTSSPALFPDLDKIAQSFRYTP